MDSMWGVKGERSEMTARLERVGGGVSLGKDRWWHWFWAGEPGDVVRQGIQESAVRRQRSGGQQRMHRIKGGDWVRHPQKRFLGERRPLPHTCC